MTKFRAFAFIGPLYHWCRLVKNIGSKPKYLGKGGNNLDNLCNKW